MTAERQKHPDVIRPEVFRPWLFETIRSLIVDTLPCLPTDDDIEPSPIEGSALGHVLLGPAAAYAWLRLADPSFDRTAEAIAMVDRYIATAPRPHFPPRVMSALFHLPKRFRPNWVPGAAIEAGATLGWLLIGLGDDLDGETRKRWFGMMHRLYDELQRQTDLTFYINGNYQLPQCEFVYLYGRLTGSESADELYERSVRFLCSPSSFDPRWEGYGLHMTTSPKTDDWQDASLHFTEIVSLKRNPTDTFDGEYTQLQLDRAVRIWLVNRDPRMLRFANGLLNSILPFVDTSTWRCAFFSGSRKDQSLPFFNSGYATLALASPRPELTAQRVQAQVEIAVDAQWRDRAATQRLDAYHLRGYGLTLLSLLVVGSDELQQRLSSWRMPGRSDPESAVA